MSDDGTHQLVGLVDPAPGETLLGPPTGGRPRLDAAGADLVRGERTPRGEPHGIPAATDQDDPERVEAERRCHRGGPVGSGRGHDDAAGSLLLGGIDRAVAFGEAGQPALESLGSDLDDPVAQRLNPRARSCSRPSSVILSGPHGGIHTQLIR